MGDRPRCVCPPLRKTGMSTAQSPLAPCTMISHDQTIFQPTGSTQHSPIGLRIALVLLRKRRALEVFRLRTGMTISSTRLTLPLADLPAPLILIPGVVSMASYARVYLYIIVNSSVSPRKKNTKVGTTSSISGLLPSSLASHRHPEGRRMHPFDILGIHYRHVMINASLTTMTMMTQTLALLPLKRIVPSRRAPDAPPNNTPHPRPFLPFRSRSHPPSHPHQRPRPPTRISRHLFRGHPLPPCSPFPRPQSLIRTPFDLPRLFVLLSLALLQTTLLNIFLPVLPFIENGVDCVKRAVLNKKVFSNWWI